MARIEEINLKTPPAGIALTGFETDEVVWPPETPPEEAALKLVVQDAIRAESHMLSQGLPTLWDKNERLYLFDVPVQFWEGTNVPRAHLGVPLVYEHVESILPQVMGALFSAWPPFDVQPLPGTSMDAARAKRALIAWALSETQFEEELRLVIKQALIQTAGVGKWGWKRELRTVRTLRRKAPELVLEGGLSVPQEGSDEFEEVEEVVEVNRPFFEFVDRRNLLIDPTLRYPDIRRARFVIHRLYLTIDQIDRLRDNPDYTIPPREELVKLAFPPKETPPENPAERLSAISTSSPAPTLFSREGSPPSVDPLATPLEVLEWTSEDRVIVVVQRKWVIRNSENRYHRIPFVSVVFSDVPGRFDGLGVSAVIGGEQRLQQGIINTRLDSLALSLHGTFVRTRGTNTPVQQLRLRPGGVIDTDTPDGVQLLRREPTLPDAYLEVQASDARAQRRTGANELIVQGGLSPRSSITRTATGVAALAAGTGARMQYFVENIGRQVFIPVLEAFSEMLSRWLRPSQVQMLLSQELGEAFEANPVDIAQAKVRFHMLAGAKLAARAALSQNLPLLFQFLLNGDVLAALAEQNKKVNIAELVKMVFDVSGWPNIQNVVVPMTEEEIQQRLANSAAALQAQQLAAQGEGRVREIEAKAEAQTVRDITRRLTDTILEQAQPPAGAVSSSSIGETGGASLAGGGSES